MRSTRTTWLVLGGWALVGLSMLIEPDAARQWRFPVACALQALQLTVVVSKWRWRGVLLDRLSAFGCIVAMLLAGGAALLTNYDPAHQSAFARALGSAIGSASLALFVAATAMMLQPFHRLPEVRRSVEFGLAGLVALAIAATWSWEAHGSTGRGALILTAIVGALLSGISGLALTASLIRLGRTAEPFGLIGIAIFALGLVISIWTSRVPVDSCVVPASITAAFGTTVALFVHPNAGLLAQRVRRRSDSPTTRTWPLALGAIIIADGAIFVLSKTGPITSTVGQLGLFGALQFVLLIWVAASVYESGPIRAWIRHRHLGGELDDAVRHQQIVPYYHPILRADDQVCVGFEALARWDHPTRGVIDGADFLPLAESRGLLATIDRQMLLAVAHDRAALLAPLTAPEPVVSMNIAPWRLEQRGFGLEVLTLLAEHGLRGDGLVIEIAETPGVFNWAALVANVETLQTAGLGLAIDDFGVGYANLGLLCELNVDLVKLDPHLVMTAMSSLRGAAVMEGAIQSAKSTGAKIVAEGVEKIEWIPELHRLGVDYVQGYGIGRPAPVELAIGLRAWKS